MAFIDTLSSDAPIIVGRVMQRSVLTAAPDEPLRTVAAKMRDARCSSIVIIEDGLPVGIWTEHDTLDCDLSSAETLDGPVRNVMSAPVKTIPEDMSLSEAGARLREMGVRHFIVVAPDGAMVGMITQTDVVLNQGASHFLCLREAGDTLTGLPNILANEDTIATAANHMRLSKSDAAIVANRDGQGYGIITERDLVRLISNGATTVAVGDVASRPLVTVPRNTTLLSAREILEERHIRHLGITDSRGDIVGLLSFADILSSIQYEYLHQLETALSQRNEALSKSESSLQLAHRVIEASREGIIITNAKAEIEHVNPAFTLVTGYQPHEVLGKNPSMLASGRHGSAFYARMWQTLQKDGFWQGEIWNRRKDGEIYPEWLRINSVKDVSGSIHHFTATFSDISERKKAEARINNLAYFDNLTGLPNRQLVLDRMNIAVAGAHRHGGRLSLMVLDLDNFKRINDSLGHSVGDDVLAEIARRLSDCLREGDTVARLSGDEFCILLTDLADIDDSIDMARRLTDVVKKPIACDAAKDLVVTTSIGISVYPEDGNTVDHLLKNADIALNRAKELGRSSFQMYSSAMNAQSLQRLAMESSLRHALERQEFEVRYQIKVSATTGMASGMEALLRWHNSDMGMVSPDDFIPLAEDTSLIHSIGAWVLEEACRQTKEWQDAGLAAIPIAVNISPLQFHRRDLFTVTKDILDRTGLDPRYLELEVTETALMQNKELVVATMNRLKALGIGFSVDDFGTGYSSLAYLKQMPIDTLKIDRSFVMDMAEDNDDAAIVSTIIAMAKRLGLSVIAEGVETLEQIRLLRTEHCDDLQGFYFAQPLPAGEITSYFNRKLIDL